ncbi:MAG: hypothetical protein ILA17_06170 [Ruminococcus sp.]|nr:hypothetical protein [Ruminiclostridium sp.]MBP1537435.1 hypothetical protein [Ruminococcus sp.]
MTINSTASAYAMTVPVMLPSAVSVNTVCIPFIDSQDWNTHIMPHIHIIGFEQNTSRTFGIFGAIRP